MILTLQQVARALHGEVSGKQVRAPGPGHSRQDRSLSVKLNDQSYFPRPMRINNRRYWLLAELEAWEALRKQEAV